MYRTQPHVMRIPRSLFLLAVPALLVSLRPANTLEAQAAKSASSTSEQPGLTAKEIAELAKLHIAISVVQDSADAQLAEPRTRLTGAAATA